MINRQEDIVKLMDGIKDYLVEPYLYKLKYPQNKTRLEKLIENEKDLEARNILIQLKKIDQKQNPKLYSIIYARYYRLKNREKVRIWQRKSDAKRRPIKRGLE